VKDYDIIITGAAEQDLIEITNYIIKKHGETPFARKVINKIGDAISNLEKLPFNHALVNDEKLVTTGIRKVMIDNYIVFYIASEKDKTVSIVRVLNIRRNWDDLL